MGKVLYSGEIPRYRTLNNLYRLDLWQAVLNQQFRLVEAIEEWIGALKWMSVIMMGKELNNRDLRR